MPQATAAVAKMGQKQGKQQDQTPSTLWWGIAGLNMAMISP